METSTVIEVVERFVEECSERTIVSLYPQIADFLNSVAGTKSSFSTGIQSWNPQRFPDATAAHNIKLILKGYRDYLKAGLGGIISPERQAQLDVVSDFLDMANTFLNSKGVHPAAPAVLIGATLEEFLRTWVELSGLSLGNKRPSLDSYSQVLRTANLITKQDSKDITAWGGIRNHAAHGEWEEVGTRERVALMLEGVNLFMRKYGA